MNNKMARCVVVLSALISGMAFGEKLDTTLFLRSAGVRASGYTGDAALTNFPLLVRLSSSRLPGFSPSDAGEGGANLRFADLNGNLLAHEVDEWCTDGESLVWVSVPVFKPGATIAVYWDPQPGAVLPAVSASDVWDSAGYVGVWHFNDTNLTNSASTDVPIYYADGCVVSNDAGKAGHCIRRTGTLTVANYLNHGVDPAHWTWSIWTKWANHTATVQKNYIMKGTWGEGWYTEYNNSASTLRLILNTTGINFGTVTAVNWNYLAMSYDGSAVRTYVNGAASATQGWESKYMTDGNRNFVLNSCGDTWQDELRVRNVVSPAGWVHAENEMTTDPDFVTFLDNVPSAPVETLGPKFTSRFDNKVRITVPGYTSASTETNFPMLVRLSRGNPRSFDPACCGNNGDGLRFFDSEGNLLPHEIDEWNCDGESLVWVLVPELNADAAVTMCWNPRPGGSIPALDPGIVWSRAGYKAVWHFASAGASMPNSAFGTMPMSPTDVAAASNVAGKVGRALSKGTSVTSPDYYAHNVPKSGPYSVSFWMKIPNLTNNDQYQPVRKGAWDSNIGNYGGWNGWMFECNKNVLRPQIGFGTNYKNVQQDVDVRQWHYYAFSYQSGSPHFYHDGTNLALATGTVQANTGAFRLDNKSSRTEQFDEVRVRAAATTSARQGVERANMTDASFVAFEVLNDVGFMLIVR